MRLKKKDQVFYLRILPEQDIKEVLRLTLRTVTDEYFVGIEEKEQHAFLFHYSDIGKVVFLTYGEALENM